MVSNIKSCVHSLLGVDVSTPFINEPSVQKVSQKLTQATISGNWALKRDPKLFEQNGV